MRRNLGIATVAALLVATGGCSSSGGGDAPSPFDGSTSSGAPQRIRIEIQNLSFNDITVFAVRTSGQRQRIARVTGKTDQNVSIEWNTAVPISFFVEQVSGISCRTGQVGVEPGARVWLAVPSTQSQPCRAGRR